MPNITASCTRRELGRPVKWTDEETAPAETGIDRIELHRRKLWRLPVGTALPPQGGEPCASPAARARHQRPSRVDWSARSRDGRDPLRARRHDHDHYRPARLWPRACLALCAGAVDAATGSGFYMDYSLPRA